MYEAAYIDNEKRQQAAFLLPRQGTPRADTQAKPKPSRGIKPEHFMPLLICGFFNFLLMVAVLWVTGLLFEQIPLVGKGWL